MRAALTAEEKLKTLSECCKCDFLGESGCQYQSLMGRPLPCSPGRVCHFNPRQPARNHKGDSIEFTEKEIKIMPAKVEIDEVKALEFYNDGKSDGYIAAYLGVSHSTIVRWRAAHCMPSHSGKIPSARKSQSKPTGTENPVSSDPRHPSPTYKITPPPHNAPSVAEPQPTIMDLLLRLFSEHPCAAVGINGHPLKSVVVLSEYDLQGNQKNPQINLLSE